MRQLLKHSLFGGARILGLNCVCHRWLRSKLLVLTYHGVVSGDRRHDRHRYHNTVSSAEFERHLQILRHEFHPVHLREVREWALEGNPLPPHAALVTFDDGYRNNLTHAAPLLIRYGVPALIFLSTGYIGGRRLLWPEELVQRILRWPHPRIAHPDGSRELDLPAAGTARAALADRICEDAKGVPDDRTRAYLDYLRAETTLPSGMADDDLYAFLTWDEVRELHRQGVEFGAHTVEHVILTQCTPDQLRRELAGGREEIRRQLGTECIAMAYPNGSSLDYSDAVVAAAREAGYELAFTLGDSFQGPATDPLRLARLMVPGHVHPAIFEARVFGAYGLFRGALFSPR